MKHILIIKLKPNTNLNEFLMKSHSYFDQLVEEVEGIKSYQFIENIVDREANGDLMLIVDLANKDMLKVYLDHPLHVEYANYLAQFMELKLSLDY